MTVFNYFDIAHAIEVHDRIIENSGGLMGVKDIGMLESPLEHMQNDLYYPNIEDKLTHLFYSINKHHGFNDGNKRSSIALSAYFLEINNLNIRVEKFIFEMENISVDVANSYIDKDLLLDIITSIIYEDDYSEDLKLKIISAKTQGNGIF